MVATVLLQLILIIVAARLCGRIARWMRQPVVVGEIIGGLLLGPTLFQPLFPDLFSIIFQPEVKPAFIVMKEMGLMFLLLIIGMEFDYSHLRHLGKSAVLISLVGICLPFAFGASLAPLLHARLDMQTPLWGLVLFPGLCTFHHSVAYPGSHHDGTGHHQNTAWCRYHFCRCC